jgi:hypothetical protein
VRQTRRRGLEGRKKEKQMVEGKVDWGRVDLLKARLGSLNLVQ